jgi:tRNA nucleotidyltransferase (CCA-adding enzyme)
MAIRVEPSSYEKRKVKKIVKELIDKFDKAHNAKDIKLEVGGSIAKNTWLPGIKDIDMFLIFNYKKYSKKSSKLSDISESMLKKCFKNIIRLHGSRDYFNLQYKNITVEVLPVLDIAGGLKALNITDYSPLHALWLKNILGEKSKIYTEIRKAKLFAKANKLYGAESYIKGFSGHVLEILTVNYGSFENFIKATTTWIHPKYIDVEDYHKGNTKKINKILTKSKLGPLVLIDPVDPKRNAAAAFNQDNFLRFIDLCNEYTKSKRKESFFKYKKTTIANLTRAKPPKTKLIVLSAKPARAKRDLAGAKILKSFELIQRKLRNYGFSVKADWEWPGEGPAILWIYTTEKLPKTYMHWGPKKTDPKIHVEAFKKKYKPKIKNNRYYITKKRTYTIPEDYLKSIISKEFKNFKIKKVV